MPNYEFNVSVTANNKEAFLRALPGAVAAALDEIGDAIVKHTRENVKSNTGALRDSYMKSVDTSTNSVHVGSPLEYSAYVELGTGPNYEKPPDWVVNTAPRGHHTEDPWWYMGDDGEWHQGWFIRATPHLRPAFTEHVDEYKQIFKKKLQNG